MKGTANKGDNTKFYHMSNSCKCTGVNGEALQVHAGYKNPYILLRVS